MPDVNVIKLRLALMGRPVRNYTFDKPTITVGRDPSADVRVDNPGISRDHCRLERTDAGEYQVVDLGSANGTFLNDQQVNTAVIRNNDVLRFGKYTLWVGYDQDRRVTGGDGKRGVPGADAHTVVLTRSELGSLLEVAKEQEVRGSDAAGPAAAPRRRSGPAPLAAILLAFVLGAALGAGAVWFVFER